MSHFDTFHNFEYLLLWSLLASVAFALSIEDSESSVTLFGKLGDRVFAVCGLLETGAPSIHFTFSFDAWLLSRFLDSFEESAFIERCFFKLMVLLELSVLLLDLDLDRGVSTKYSALEKKLKKN